jgi:hypothetical protein
VRRPILLRLLALLLALQLPLSAAAAPWLVGWAEAQVHAAAGHQGHHSHDAAGRHGGAADSDHGHAHRDHAHHDHVAADAAAATAEASADATASLAAYPADGDLTHHHEHCAFCHIAGSLIAPALAAAPVERGAHVLVASRPQLRVAGAPEAPFRPPSALAR